MQPTLTLYRQNPKVFSLSLFHLISWFSESKKVFKIFILEGTKFFPGWLIPSGCIRYPGPINTVARTG